ncbi:hypothetical protein [Variovorax boronicumulans]|uniref:hypothetical protein n=1 Tax=Variovorax boronicumulans TaxID=436515 RepID=UPI000BB2D18B|nr:hypothetical protein [Variovorax boronicumulans]
MPLFEADHGNLAEADAALAVGLLGAGLAAMCKQKGLAGEYIDPQPRLLIVPAALQKAPNSSSYECGPIGQVGAPEETFCYPSNRDTQEDFSARIGSCEDKVRQVAPTSISSLSTFSSYDAE